MVPNAATRRGEMPYITRHGFGYSVFEHTERGIRSEVWTYVALDAAIKFTVLKVKNKTGRARRLSATAAPNGFWATSERKQPCT